jgi:uridine kinase
MKGDKIIVQDDYRQVAREIVSLLIGKIQQKKNRYIISVAGESGSGKSVTGQALFDELQKYGIRSVVLGLDDYFVLPPKTNDQKRRMDPSWLGPHVEVRLDVLDQNLQDALQGKREIRKPLVDYNADSIGEEVIDLTGIQVVIAEGTYTSLLKHVDTRIFITRTWLETLEDRQRRNRGNEAGDPFIEGVLAIEHMIIAGHHYLADVLITRDFNVVLTD